MVGRHGEEASGMKGSILVAAGLLALAVPARAEMLVATVGPMTGQYAIFGEQMRRGAAYMAERINQAGGINGEPIRLEIGDDACDPRQAVSVANQMAVEGAKVVIGHYCSGSSIPASAVYHENGVLQITPASTNPKLTEQGFDNVFRTCGRDDVQGIYAANYVVDNKLADKIAILSGNLMKLLKIT